MSDPLLRLCRVDRRSRVYETNRHAGAAQQVRGVGRTHLNYGKDGLLAGIVRCRIHVKGQHVNEQTEMWLQYTHLDKLYSYLPGIPEAVPAIFNLTPAEYTEITGRFDAQAREAAAELLTDEAFAADVDALPFQSNQIVLAVGDSITDDARSWVEILRHLLDIRRPTDHVHVVNDGLSAHTTAMALRRWPATLTSIGPDWVVCALGCNDVTRVGPEPTKSQVSLTESVANLAEMRRIADVIANPTWVWMTPPPVCEDRVADFPGFRYGQSSWRNTDITALADAMKKFPDPVIDLVDAFGVPADPGMQGPDGVHPGIHGQTTITRTLIETLAADNRTAHG